MKLQRLFSLLFAMMLVVSLTGCGKDDDDNEPSQRDLLTAGQWTGVAIFANGQDFTQLFLDELGYDIKKNIMKFDKAGTYIDNYERISLNGTWEFTNNEQSILFDKGTDDEYVSRILRLTSTELFVEQPLELDEDQTINLEIRYRR